MAEPEITPQTVRLSRRSDRAPVEVELVPDADLRAPIAARLGLLALRKLRFAGTLIPEGKRDWRLEATLGATVVQPCIVTLAPVTTRIDVPVTRRYLSEMPVLPEGDEIEMPEDDSTEPLPETLDLVQVMVEALALALPLYPRADGAELGDAAYAPPRVAPLTDEDTKPFAALAELKRKLDP